MSRAASLLLVSLLASATGAACASPPEPAKPVPPPPAPAPKTTFPEPRADGRLPPLAKPVSYVLAFDVDPNQERFAGRETIDVTIPVPTSYVVLNGHALDVTKASATVNGRVIPINVTPRKSVGGSENEELVLDLAEIIPAGTARLELAWTAPFDKELSGLYRVKEDGRWYAFTQFESTDARRAFPSFDEPGEKTPFAITLNVPKGMSAFSNNPEASHTETAHVFKQTPPLPTYLVAFAVGELEVRELTSRTQKPAIRAITTKGKSGLTQLALESTSALVDELGAWFGIPYPFDKLDIVAVPEFAAGAMENAGLITYRSELLLLDPARASVRARRSQAEVEAHELAHQWFGDLVTAAWWNDIWLNEGMATWMESRIVEKWQPTWGAKDDAALSALWVMDDDSLATARAVRQPVASTSEAEEAFDGITYQKGAAVLSTIENWVGEEAFHRGIHTYLTENANANATTDRLFASLDRAAGKDVTKMAATFLDRAGVPVVTATRTCEVGGRFNVELSQEQWRPVGSTIKVDPNRSWILPVCVKAQGEKKDMCAELSQGAPSLAAGRGCPSWFHPNANGSYYRFEVDEKDVLALGAARSSLDVPQRAGVLVNAWASVRAGKLSPAAFLRLLPSFDDDKSRAISSAVVSLLYDLNEAFVDDATRPAFAKFVRARLGRKLAALGYAAKKNEPADDAIMRRSLFGAMADLGADEPTLKEAEAITVKWLADPTSVDPDLAAMAVAIASRRSGEARLEQLENIVKSPKTDEDRVIALRAAGSFEDPNMIGKAFAFTLTDSVRTGDMRYVLGTMFGQKKTRGIAEAWVRGHWAELQKKLPGSLGRSIVRGAGNACSKAEIDEHAAWYGAHIADIPGGKRELAELIEADGLCASLRDASGSAFSKALAK